MAPRARGTRDVCPAMRSMRSCVVLFAAAFQVYETNEAAADAVMG